MGPTIIAGFADAKSALRRYGSFSPPPKGPTRSINNLQFHFSPHLPSLCTVQTSLLRPQPLYQTRYLYRSFTVHAPLRLGSPDRFPIVYRYRNFIFNRGTFRFTSVFPVRFLQCILIFFTLDR